MTTEANSSTIHTSIYLFSQKASSITDCQPVGAVGKLNVQKVVVEW
jgi:hypothetical protein